MAQYRPLDVGPKCPEDAKAGSPSSGRQSSARRRTRKAKTYTRADDEAFLSSAGGWKDFDLEGFLKNNEESRRSSRLPVEL